MAIPVTGTMKPMGSFPLAEAEDVLMPDGTRLSEWKGSTGADTRITLLAEQDFSGFAADARYGGLYTKDIPFGADIESFTLCPDSKYVVVWDTDEWTVTAQDFSAILEGAVGIGDCSAMIPSLPGNGEPFVVGWAEDGLILCSLYETKETHKVGIYQVLTDHIETTVKSYVDEYISAALEGDY